MSSGPTLMLRPGASSSMVPIAADLARQQRSAKLKPSAASSVVTVDLRKPAQLAKSVLFHRLTLLGIDWAVPVETGRTTGTFKEAWLLEWQPQFSIDVIMAGVYGTTVESAVAAKVAHDARATSDLPTLAALVEACLLAELPAGLHEVLDELAARTAQQHDALLLLQAVEPLARTYRYGDVRGGDPAAVARVLDVLVTRAALGLGSAVASIDDDRASEARTAIEAAHRGVSLAEISPLREQWYRALTAVAEQPLVHGAVQGRVVRLLLDAGELPIEAVRAHVSRNLSRAADARHGAAWLDGWVWWVDFVSEDGSGGEFRLMRARADLSDVEEVASGTVAPPATTWRVSHAIAVAPDAVLVEWHAGGVFPDPPTVARRIRFALPGGAVTTTTPDEALPANVLARGYTDEQFHGSFYGVAVYHPGTGGWIHADGDQVLHSGGSTAVGFSWAGSFYPAGGVTCGIAAKSVSLATTGAGLVAAVFGDLAGGRDRARHIDQEQGIVRRRHFGVEDGLIDDLCKDRQHMFFELAVLLLEFLEALFCAVEGQAHAFEEHLDQLVPSLHLSLM